MTEIEAGGPPPKIRKPRKAKAEKLPPSKLASALKFVSVANRDTDQVYQSHVALAMKQAMSFDGVTAAGYPIDEDWAAVPNADRLLDALDRAKTGFSVTIDDSANRLTVAGGKFKAVVPCITWDQMPYMAPDACIAPLNDNLKLAFQSLNPFVQESAPLVMLASLQLGPQTCEVCDNKSLVQAWHGIDLPPNLIVPKSFVNAVARTELSLTGFGWTEGNSVTFWFENGAWIKTQLYREGWRDIRFLLDGERNYTDTPKGFFEGVDACAGFGDGKTYLYPNAVQSHPDAGEGASMDVPGLDCTATLDTKTLQRVSNLAQFFDFNCGDNKRFIAWQGVITRGVMSKGI